MREILFRGVSTDSVEWVEGWFEMYPYSRWPLKATIVPAEEAKDGYFHHVEVIPETVGQYTGLTDKNGKKMFEGDIVKALRICNQEVWTGYVVMWKGCFAIKDAKTRNVPAIDLFNVYEVIGNIHDNPELLKGGAEDGK